MYLLFVSELVSARIFLHTFFLNKDGLNKKTINPIYYVNIKSKGLRNILKTVLRNIRAVNLNKNKFAI